MADLLNPQTLELFLLFVVPGFVAMKAHDLLIPAPTRNWGDSLIEVVSYSMLNLGLLFWLVAILQREGFQERHPATYQAGMFVVVVVAPVVWAVLARFLRTSRLLRRFVLHPSPTAWDFFFEQRRRVWVLFHLSSGKMLGGLLAEHSCASSFPNDEDIYVEEVWKLDEEGRFLHRIEQTAGALIKRAECTHIELFAASKEKS